MNTTEFALKLIQDYNTEHNRYRRARAAVARLQRDRQWYDEALRAGIASFYHKTAGVSYKEAHNSFLGRTSNTPTNTIFVSSGAPAIAVRGVVPRATCIVDHSPLLAAT